MKRGIALEVAGKAGSKLSSRHQRASLSWIAERDPQLVATAHHCLLNALVDS